MLKSKQRLWNLNKCKKHLAFKYSFKCCIRMIKQKLNKILYLKKKNYIEEIK